MPAPPGRFLGSPSDSLSSSSELPWPLTVSVCYSPYEVGLLTSQGLAHFSLCPRGCSVDAASISASLALTLSLSFSPVYRGSAMQQDPI